MDMYNPTILVSEVSAIPGIMALLSNDMHVLICKHSACFPELASAFTVAGDFTRDDGTSGHAGYLIGCDHCTKIDRKEVTSLEYVWKIDRFHSCDFPCKQYDEAGHRRRRAS